MALLYLITESERDALFYAQCAQLLGGQEISDWKPLANRKGDGAAAVKKQMQWAVKQAQQAALGQETVCLIAAIDNDRSSHEENARTLQRMKLSKQEQSREPRLQWMLTISSSALGKDGVAQRLQSAIAVPVEMLEAWTVKALGADQPGGPMPHFSWQHQAKAKAYYAPSAPPLQWKDLEALAREKLDLPSDEDFYAHVVQVIAQDPESLAQRSLSFRLFWDQLKAWKPSRPVLPSPP